jgi:hypothetical protein
VDLIVGNLLSVPVLAFALGIFAASVRADLRLPDAVYQATSMYLLFAIGLKGGVALRESPISDVGVPLLFALFIGILIPILAFMILRVITKLDRIDRGAMAAHYGSTSLVTFTAAIVFLDQSGIPFEGFVVTLLVLLEIPGILVGLYLARNLDVRWSDSLREVLTSRSILLLAGGVVIGALTGPAGYLGVEPFFGALFTGVLALFLLEMGVLTGRRMGAMRTAGVGVIFFAIGFPLLAGAIGVLAGAAAGLSAGGAMVLGVLSASASYIAAPAAVRLALPEANPGITLTSSLGITFPFNLIIGIPIYWWMAQTVVNSGWWFSL